MWCFEIYVQRANSFWIAFRSISISVSLTLDSISYSFWNSLIVSCGTWWSLRRFCPIHFNNWCAVNDLVNCECCLCCMCCCAYACPLLWSVLSSIVLLHTQTTKLQLQHTTIHENVRVRIWIHTNKKKRKRAARVSVAAERETASSTSVEAESASLQGIRFSPVTFFIFYWTKPLAMPIITTGSWRRWSKHANFVLLVWKLNIQHRAVAVSIFLYILSYWTSSSSLFLVLLRFV